MKQSLFSFSSTILLLFTFPFLGLTQNDSTQIKQVVLELFDGMRAADTAMVRGAFQENANLFTTAKRSEKNELITYEVGDFVRSVGTPHEEIYDERLGEYSLEIDDILATMAVEYYFYLGESPSHCGTNFFTFFKSEEGWKIISIADTRRKEGCELPAVTW